MPHVVRSRPGLDEFSLGLNPFTVGFQLALHEIGPVSRNPERDTERSRVVPARSPSLSTIDQKRGPPLPEKTQEPFQTQLDQHQLFISRDACELWMSYNAETL